MNAVLFEDLANTGDIIKSIAKLEAANAKFADSAVAQNERVAQSLKSVRDEAIALREQISNQSSAKIGGNSGLSGLKDDVKKLTQAEKDYQAVLSRNQQLLNLNSASVAAMKKRVADLKTEYNNLDRAEEKNVARQKEISKELRQTSTVLNTLTKVTLEATKANIVAQNSYNSLDRATQKLRQDLKNLENGFDPLTGKINQHNRIAVEMQKQIDKNSKALLNADRQMGLSQRNVGNYASVVKEIAGELVGFSSLAGGVAIAFEAIKVGVTIMGEMERANQGLKAASRDNADFVRSQQFLISLADKLGVEYHTLIDNYKKLKGATRDTVLEGRATEKIFTAISTAGAKLGLTTETIEGTLKALTDMISKGSIQAEELKGQLGDRLPGALRLLSEALGVSQTKLLKMMESGELLATDVLPKLAGKLGETYSLDTNQKIENMAAGVARVKNETALLLDTFNNNSRITSFFGAISTGIANVLRDARLALQDGSLGDFLLMFTPAHLLSSSLGDRIGRRRAADQTMSDFNGMEPAKRKKLIQDLITQEADLRREGETKMAEDIQSLRLRLQRQNIKLELAERQAASRQESIEARANVERNEADLARFQAQSVKKRTAEIIALEKQLAADPKNEVLKAKLDVYRRLDAEQKAKDKEVKDRLKPANDDTELEKLDKQIKDIEKTLQSQALADLKAGRAITIDQKLVDRVTELKRQFEAIKETMEQVENGTYNKKRVTSTINPIATSDLDRIGERPYVDYSLTRQGKQLTEAEIRDAAAKRLADQTKNLADQAGIMVEYDTKRRRLEYDFNNDLHGLTQQRKVDLMTLLAQMEEAERKGDKDEVQRLKDKYAQMMEADRDYLQTKQQIQEKYYEVGASLINGLFDIEQQKNQNRLTALEKQKEYELSTVGDNEAAKAAIEKKYDAQSKQIQHQQDVAARNQALFNIAISTAVEVSKSLSKPGLAIAIALLGAVQAGIVLAKPLPQYKDGKNVSDLYEGPAEVGEAGRELLFRDGQPTLIDKPSIIQVKRRDIILPNPLTERMLSDERAWEANGLLHRSNLQKQAVASLSQNRELYQTRMISAAMGFRGPSAGAIGKAVGNEIAKHPKNLLSWDKHGFNVSVQEANTRRKIQKDKHRLS
ncbi:tape measure protein [Spirosoma foliorum]|uniref:Tape measure protein n=1 Tax=Spirosoma foliorum TaxID=2710596 RepID=A0A7G5H5G4_9BACT|nr:tape measure protein [Spirosoma foliorum]QMW06356.1 tape measure protein [Spirosoma foliorum]